MAAALRRPGGRRHHHHGRARQPLYVQNGSAATQGHRPEIGNVVELRELERLFAATAGGKAPGIDAIPSSILRVDPSAIARIVHLLAVKLGLLEKKREMRSLKMKS